jgi:hypothetical protein
MSDNGVSTGVRTTTLVAARELFVGVLYMTTLPFVICDIGVVAFSTTTTCNVAAFLGVMSIQSFLAVRSLLTMVAYNAVCYTLLIRSSASSRRVMISVGCTTLAWNVLGCVGFPWWLAKCSTPIAYYLPVSSAMLLVMYSWCVPWPWTNKAKSA